MSLNLLQCYKIGGEKNKLLLFKAQAVKQFGAS